MNAKTDAKIPRPRACAETADCLRDRPGGVSARPRPGASRGRPPGLLGLWARRLAWARLRARSFCRVTGIFDGCDLP